MYIPVEENIASVCPFFRRGALEVLGMIKGVTPVATFTGMPQLPPEHSSEVCRHPLPLPPLDLDLVTKDIEDFKLPAYDKDDNAQRRSRTTLQFHLRLKVRQMQIKNPGTQTFLQDFKEAASEQVLEKALENCMKLCPFIIPSSYKEDINAVELLMGVDETDFDFNTYQTSVTKS